MFHSDFKQHIKAIDTLSSFIDQDLQGLISNLDLVLKWTTLRFFETNPSVLLRALEYLNDAFSALADNSYSLHDIEAVSFIPYLINKVNLILDVQPSVSWSGEIAQMQSGGFVSGGPRFESCRLHAAACLANNNE